MKNVKIFAKSIIIPLIVGGIVGLIISKQIDYNNLIKPNFSPPSMLFPIAWTILYVLMGISYGILDSSSKIDKKTNIIYYTQLFINAMWSIFFFVFKWRFFSFLWIIFLLISVIGMSITFYKKNKISSILQLPYILWTSFATYLNFAIYLLNK